MKSLSDLDTLIVDAEQRLAAREARLRHDLTQLEDTVADALNPQRLLAPALGAGLGLGAVVLLAKTMFGRRLHGHAAAAHAHAGAPVGGQQHMGGDYHMSWQDRLLSLLRTFTALWPLVPERWREKVPPQVVDVAVAAQPLVPLVMDLLPRRRGW